MNRELLEKPFDPNQIKQREGNFGKMLDYIEGHTVVKRLNDSFEANWSFAILKHEILKETDEVVVLGELSANGIVKTQFGSSKITRARETGELISLADDLKAAATDSLKCQRARPLELRFQCPNFACRSSTSPSILRPGQRSVSRWACMLFPN